MFKSASCLLTISKQDQDHAILQLKRQRDRLQKYTVKINLIVQRETDIARELLSVGRKPQALLALKKKKYQLQQLSRAEAHMLNIEQLVSEIENAHVRREVFEALSVGNAALQRLNEEVSVEAVEQLMGESQEAIAYQDQVSLMLGNSLTPDDLHQCQRELEEIEELALVNAFNAAPVAERTPNAIESEPVSTPLPKREVVSNGIMLT